MAETHHTVEAPAWSISTTDEVEEVDEPPEPLLCQPAPERFHRTTIRRPYDTSSLLTKAFLQQSDDEAHDLTTFTSATRRRRSMTSNVSIASTADLTSDTGLTSPCRTNTPSPPLPDLAILRLNEVAAARKEGPPVGPIIGPAATTTPKEAPRKRCIQFACAAKPQPQVEVPRAEPMVKTPSAQEAPRRPCIKFMSLARPASTQNTPPRQAVSRSPRFSRVESPSTPKKHQSTSASTPSLRPATVEKLSSKLDVQRPKFLRASSKDLAKDGSQFHEFASGLNREDDWIRQGHTEAARKLTINDTLIKENNIRRLAVEAEEEAELEEQEDEEADMEDDEDDEDDDDNPDNDDDDNEDGDDDEDVEEEFDNQDGYSTDEETGFADSDEEEDDADGLDLWTPGRANNMISQGCEVPRLRRSSVGEVQSDSSAATSTRSSTRRIKAQRIQPRSETPYLPDSTDFVCGTLDEDRPLEEAYLSCLAARRNGKLRIIPQDIDPSFPASDPDNDDEEDRYNPVHHGSDEHVWMQGDMEDLHHEHDRSRRRRKSEHGHASPRKLRSPPPKRLHSPPPKGRGRSPKPLFDRHSPRRMRSPAPRAMTTPTVSPRQGPHTQFNLAGRPGATHTKSLPRPAALFPHMKHGRPKTRQQDDIHVRSAIDIVKGLEKKRQRRKEKFHQKYCNRARRGQIPERKAQPGRGAERMRELGLLMAGKKDTGNYVLSV